MHQTIYNTSNQPNYPHTNHSNKQLWFLPSSDSSNKWFKQLTFIQPSHHPSVQPTTHTSANRSTKPQSTNLRIWCHGCWTNRRCSEGRGRGRYCWSRSWPSRSKYQRTIISKTYISFPFSLCLSLSISVFLSLSIGFPLSSLYSGGE